MDEEVETLLTAWVNAPAAVLPVRILNLDASDVWSADLHYGTVTSLTVGYGAPATGTLTATGFSLNGVEYTVDRLTVATNTSAVAVVRFATTPDLPATARLRLAVPRFYTSPGLNRYLALEPASRVSGGTDVDYEWPWSGGRPNLLADETATFYLTRAPGRTGDVSGFWEATLTPNDRQPHPPDLVGYRGAGLNIPGFPYEPAGAGTLAPASVSLGGVTYTVDVLAIVSDSDDYLNLSLRTDPLLPRGQDLWLELEHVDGSTAVFAIDTATVEAPGYRWRAVYAGEDRHRWGTDGSDADTDIDAVTVRLAMGAPTITGTAHVGETLTAVTTGITDADGLTSPTYTYQWIQVNGTAADIADADSSTYTLVDADLGKAIKVKVSFTDDASNAETRTSAATATVTVDPTTVPAVLVSNVGQETVDGPFISGTEAAQSFTTGGNPTGYTLTSIELRLPTIEDPDDPPAVKLFRGSANGTEVATFTGPAMLDANTEKNYAFTPSTTVNLFARTTYWVVIVGDGNWSVTPFATSVDATSAPGWRIGERADRPVGSTGGFTASQVSKFQIRVNGTVGITPVTDNDPPTVANEIPDQTATEGGVFSYTFPTSTFADPDASDTLTYTATQSGEPALPSWLSFDDATRTFSGTPATADVGTVPVTVTATDNISGSASATFDIVVSAVATAQDIDHPRVLMDTQITVGGYRQDDSTDVDHWGYADGPAVDADQVAVTVHDGSLGDAAFVYRGVEYTVKRLTISTSSGSLEIEIEDADAAALPDTAAVGIELQGSPTGETVLFDWRQRARSDVESEVETLLVAWRDAPGTVLPVRILNLDASDVWSANLHYGTLTSLTVGYGAPATGTLTATGFFLNGVEYTVDRLTVTTNASAVAVVRFATTPDLPATARLRLAVPRTLPDPDLDPALDPGLNRYLALEPASRVSGGTDVDYEWPWPGVNGPETLADDTNTFYLTRAQGRTGDVSELWEATLIPNTHASTLVGYRRAAVTIPDFTHEAAGAGTLTPGTMSLRGVEYTVDALAVVSVTSIGWNVALRTDPLLPRGQDLWLELEHVDGSTAVFAIDTASVEAPGYLWRLVYAGDRHGWGTDSADADTDIDSVTVRLLLGAPTITGTAQVGETLTAVTTGITDADGLTSATYTYQWIRVNGTAADIAGENSSTYVLSPADRGKAIKVKVSFTDDASNAETRTSAATAPVTADTTHGVLVSNIGQADGGDWFSTGEIGSSFTTGGVATTLTSIEIRLRSSVAAAVTPTVKVFTGSVTGLDLTLGTEVAALTGPASIPVGTGNYTFTPQTSTALAASTTYYVLIQGLGSGLIGNGTDSSDNVDSSSMSGWGIPDSHYFRNSGSTGTLARRSSSGRVMFRVNGLVGTNARPTVANEIPDQTATARTEFNYAFADDTFTDADGDTLTYTATQSDDSALPSWLSFARATRTFSGTPATADVGTVSVTVTASDGRDSVSDTFDIVVSADATATCAGQCLVSNLGQTVDNFAGVGGQRCCPAIHDRHQRHRLHPDQYRASPQLQS